MNTDQIKKLQRILETSENIVFFGGAGVSTESGIPDFRSVNGIYDQKWNFPPKQYSAMIFLSATPKIFSNFIGKKCFI